MTTNNPAQALIDLKPAGDYFIGVDSDGCVFDTMEIKHKECFIPNIIAYFGLQAVSKYAREAAEFVNLYSKWRGVNRFPALIESLDQLRVRPKVAERGFETPLLSATRAWLADESRPGNAGLEAALNAADTAAADELRQVLAWSLAVNRTVAEIVRGVPPFPHARACLAQAAARADIVVISATPHEALEREWTEHDLAKHVAVIAGQEMGAKRDHLRLAAGGKYRPDRVLMVGDAPGDLAAARANGVLFYPIDPGAEADSWARFEDEALPRFFAGEYAGDYEAARIEAFEALLPDAPPWPRVGTR